MDGTMKPPHGLMGLDTSHDFPWIMVIIATMLGVFILCTVYHLYRTKMMNRPQKEKSPTQLIREIKLGMENLKIIESSDYKTHFAQISLNLREALEQFVNLPLRDLTTEEIESRLSAQWPLTKPFGEFIDILLSLIHI